MRRRAGGAVKPWVVIEEAKCVGGQPIHRCRWRAIEATRMHSQGDCDDRRLRPLDPEGGHQLKYYVADIGMVGVGATGGVNPEVLRLTHRTRLTDSALHRIDLQLLARDRRGYRISPQLYGKTMRATIGVDRKDG